MAELSLDDGSSLALGAEASNTNSFDFLPPPPEMLPAPSPLLREPRKYGSGGSTGTAKERVFEGKRVAHSSVPPPAEVPAFPKEVALPGAAVAAAVPTAVPTADKEVEVEAELEENGAEEDLVDDAPPSATVAADPSLPAPVMGKPPRGARKEGEAAGASAGPSAVAPEAAGAAAAAAAGAGAGAAGGAGGAGGGGAAGPGAGGAAAAAAAAGGDPVGEDDYQAYYLSAASEEGADRGIPDNNHEEEPDIFAGIKPLEQEGRMEVSAEIHLGHAETLGRHVTSRQKQK